MTNRNGVIQCAIVVPALTLTEEEKTAHRLKFEAWYTSFRETHKDFFEAKEKGVILDGQENNF